MTIASNASNSYKKLSKKSSSHSFFSASVKSRFIVFQNKKFSNVHESHKCVLHLCQQLLPIKSFGVVKINYKKKYLQQQWRIFISFRTFTKKIMIHSVNQYAWTIVDITSRSMTSAKNKQKFDWKRKFFNSVCIDSLSAFPRNFMQFKNECTVRFATNAMTSSLVTVHNEKLRP